MKLFLSMLLCLLMTGCGAKAPEPAPTVPEPVTLYAPGSAIEEETNGAVRAYPISEGSGLCAMGNKLLLFSGTDETTLRVLSGETLRVEAEKKLGFLLDPQDPSVRVQPDRIFFYNPTTRETLVLDGALNEQSRIAAPADMVGSPILSRDESQLYYLTHSAIRAWDLPSGVRRPVKELAVPGLQLTDLHEDQGLVQCTAAGTTLIMSAKDGRLLWDGKGSLDLTFRDGTCTAAWDRGAGQHLLLGTDTQLVPQGLARGQFLSCGLVTRDGDILTYYDPASGRRESTLRLKSVTQAAQTDDEFVYLLTPDALYRWETSALPTGDTALYTAPYGPNQGKLDLCQAYAQRIGEKYGVEVLIGQEAVSNPPWDYELEPETLPALIEQALLQLDACLSRYPADLLADTVSHFSSLKLCLVRQITGVEGAVAAATGLQYLSGTDEYLALAIGPLFRRSVYHEFYHVMETHLLGATAAFDRWERLNPTGFAYDFGLRQNLDRYLTGDRRAFIDRYAMSYPKEDRARIMEYAMEPGNEELFQSPVLQAKLETLCLGIRQAYGLKKSPESFLWEQYLTKPLSPP